MRRFPRKIEDALFILDRVDWEAEGMEPYGDKFYGKGFFIFYALIDDGRSIDFNRIYRFKQKS